MDICGYCGERESNPNDANCSNCQADYWVQTEDFKNPDLKDYIAHAANNLDISVEKLQDMVECPDKKKRVTT